MAVSDPDARSPSGSDRVKSFAEQYGNWGDSEVEDLEPDTTSAAEVQAQLEVSRQQIFDDWTTLRAILTHHEATIHRRWLKMTKVRRRNIFLSAWPGMAPSHRPDFEAWRQSSSGHPEAAARFRETCLFPHINLEDLTKPRSLLLFLKARSQNSPDAFAMADGKAAHLGWATQAIRYVFLSGHTMVFTGRKDVASYGELVRWKDNYEAMTWLGTEKGVRPAYGLLILEVQQRTMRFLVDCCQGILHDIPAHALTESAGTRQLTPTLDSATVDGFAVRAIIAAEAPYRSPAELDLVKLESIVAAKVSAAEDHVLSLREDPSYFVHTLHRYREHRPELIEWQGSQADPLTKTRHELWGEVIDTVVFDAYMLLGTWIGLHQSVQEAHRLQEKHAAEISIDKELPREYMDALLRLRFFLNQSVRGQLGPLRLAVAASPPLRRNIQRWPSASDDPGKVFLFEQGADGMEAKGKSLWLLRTLRDPGMERKMLRLVALPSFIDELERLVHVEDEARDLLSEHVAGIIGDLAICTEGLRQLELYQPWASAFDRVSTFKKLDVVDDFQRRTKHLGLLDKLTRGRASAQIARLGDPDDKKFHYPCDKRRTKENVEAMRTAEGNLDALWAAIDRHFAAVAGEKLNEHPLKQLFAQTKALQRTPEWTKPSTKKTSTAKGQVSKAQVRELGFELEYRTESTVSHAASRISAVSDKKKTRGVPKPALLESIAVREEESQTTKGSTIGLDARALKTMRSLFHAPSMDATPAAIPWRDFLHVMVSTGFAPEKLYGSVWQFAPDQLDVDRSIQFHEPHPDGKLQYLQARRFGRRLNRAYGWTGDSFELKTKVSA